MPQVTPTTFSLVHAKPCRGKEWRVSGYADNKRQQFWFRTEKEAKAYAKTRNLERAAHGSTFTITPELRLDVVHATQILEPHGKSLSEAARFYADYLERTAVPRVTVSELAERVRAEFDRRVNAVPPETKPRNRDAMAYHLRALEATFGTVPVDEVTMEALREWLTNSGLAAKTRNVRRGYLGQVFGFAVDGGYLKTNPMARIKKFGEHYNEEAATGSLDALETERLFRAADPTAIPFLGLWFFAGIRRETIEAMGWERINFETRRIDVPRTKGKNKRRYLVDMSDNLIEWLLPHRQASGSLLAASVQPQTRGNRTTKTTRNRVLKAAKAAGFRLHKNAGRNSFISMHMALYENAAKTALQANTSPAMIERDYKDYFSKEQAVAYWNIRPLPTA